MTRRTRLLVFAVGAIGVAVVLGWGLLGVPKLGHYRGPYGDVINRQALGQRHAQNIVNVVTFDYRGIDTVGEEFILFGAVIGVTLLLRRQRDEHEQDSGRRAKDIAFAETSDAVRAFSLLLIAPTVVLGLYLVMHGHLSPGGGFQGGLILGAAPLFVYLAGRYLVFRAVSPMGLLDLGEGIGAAGFVAVGLVGLVATGVFLQDRFPLGQVGSVFSGGYLPVLNLSVGIEVAAGLVLVVYEFLEQTLLFRGS